MKKLKKVVSMLMISALFILPTSMSTQAEESEVIKKESNVITLSVSDDFEKTGYVNANNVNLRNSSWVSLGQMNYGDAVYLDFSDVRIWNGNVMIHCYSVTLKQEGFVCQSYVTVTGNAS